jgi:hypothetical protein
VRSKRHCAGARQGEHRENRDLHLAGSQVLIVPKADNRLMTGIG